MNVAAVPQYENDLLASERHVLVIGGPGSGKTTIALKKAVHRIRAGLKPSQSILFLSFSRAAVKRLAEASSKDIPKDQRDKLNLQTFHSFFWTLLTCHAYLLGCLKPLQILLPHDERALSFGIKADEDGWAEWLIERERLFIEEGKIAFDLFAPKLLELVEKSSSIKKLICQKYPMIVVDEAQDTSEIPWKVIEALSGNSQIICLADLEQQIFDHLPGIGPERIDAIKVALNPLEIDLGQQNNRSPDTEIAIFGHDILHNTPRGSSYDGVSKFVYDPREALNLSLRRGLAVLYKKIRLRGGDKPDSCAILVTSGREVAQVTAALSNELKPVPHKVIFDEAHVLLASRFAAYLLEPKYPNEIASHMIDSLELLAAYERASGTQSGRKNSQKYMEYIAEYKAGGFPRNTKLIKGMTAVLISLCVPSFKGDPRIDWLFIKKLLRESGDASLIKISQDLDYLVAFGRGRLLCSNLSTIWSANGEYIRAKQTFDMSMTQEAMMEAAEDHTGILVMTIHRSKGKQFDGVMIVRRGNSIGPKKWRSSFAWREDLSPHLRSRKILRVGITRARRQLLILDPRFPGCPILQGHVF